MREPGDHYGARDRRASPTENSASSRQERLTISNATAESLPPPTGTSTRRRPAGLQRAAAPPARAPARRPARPPLSDPGPARGESAGAAGGRGGWCRRAPRAPPSRAPRAGRRRPAAARRSRTRPGRQRGLEVADAGDLVRSASSPSTRSRSAALSSRHARAADAPGLGALNSRSMRGGRNAVFLQAVGRVGARKQQRGSEFSRNTRLDARFARRRYRHSRRKMAARKRWRGRHVTRRQAPRRAAARRLDARRDAGKPRACLNNRRRKFMSQTETTAIALSPKQRNSRAMRWAPEQEKDELSKPLRRRRRNGS